MQQVPHVALLAWLHLSVQQAPQQALPRGVAPSVPPLLARVAQAWPCQAWWQAKSWLA